MQEPTLQPVRHAPLRGLIEAQLIDSIVSGQLPAGSRLTETELAEQLGTSRIPVREALQAAARDGWVDLLPRQGARVHVPQISEVEDVFAVRAALESECARVAAANASTEEIQELRRLIRTGRSLAEAEDEVGASQANTEFHRQVAAIAGNRVMSQVLSKFELRIRWYFSHVAGARGVQSWIEHDRILDAILAGDAEQAAHESRHHTQATLAAFHRYASHQRAESE